MSVQETTQTYNPKSESSMSLLKECVVLPYTHVGHRVSPHNIHGRAPMNQPSAPSLPPSCPSAAPDQPTSHTSWRPQPAAGRRLLFSLLVPARCSVQRSASCRAEQQPLPADRHTPREQKTGEMWTEGWWIQERRQQSEKGESFST